MGQRHGAAGRGRADGPQRRRARADPPRLHGDHRRQWRGCARDPRPASEPIDLLISDVVMPGMDGPTMVREARESRPELKILFMSGYAEEQLQEIDRHRERQFPSQAVLGDRACRSGAPRGGGPNKPLRFCSAPFIRCGTWRGAFHSDRRGRAAHRDDARGFPRFARPQGPRDLRHASNARSTRSRRAGSTSRSST